MNYKNIFIKWESDMESGTIDYTDFDLALKDFYKMEMENTKQQLENGLMGNVFLKSELWANGVKVVSTTLEIQDFTTLSNEITLRDRLSQLDNLNGIEIFFHLSKKENNVTFQAKELLYGGTIDTDLYTFYGDEQEDILNSIITKEEYMDEKTTRYYIDYNPK